MRFCCQKFIDLLLSDWIWNLQCCVFWIWITYITVLFVHITWSLKIRTNQNKINLFWKCILLRMIHLGFFCHYNIQSNCLLMQYQTSVCVMYARSLQSVFPLKLIPLLSSVSLYSLCNTHLTRTFFFFPFSVIHFTQLQISIQKKCHHSLL